MQQLHLVGVTTENDTLICSARKGAKSGSFALPLDERLLQVIAEAVQKRNADGVAIEVPEALQPAVPAAPRRQSHLSPREIQDRLRAGRSLEVIAAEAGVGEEWVARFAAPVEAERLQVVNRARALTYERPRRGDSGEPLGMAVRWNLADRGVRLTNDEFDSAWSAFHLAGQAWMVTFTFVSRKRTQEAEWEVDLGTGELLSRNRLGTELGYVEPGRRRRPAASLQPMPSTARGSRPAARPSPSAVEPDAGAAEEPARKTTRTAAKRRTSPTSSATRATAARKAPGGTAKRAATRKSSGGTAKRAVARKAAPSTAKRAPARKAAPSTAKRASTRKAAARTATRKAVAAPAKRPATRKAAPRAATRAPARKATRSAAKRVPAKKSATPARGARRPSTPAKKAAARRTRARGVPPAAVAATTAAVEPNELSRRRLQLATGTTPPAPRKRTTAPSAAPATPQGVRIAAARSGDVVRPATAPPPPPRPEPPEPGLDIVDEEAMAEARRAERRRARAEARARQDEHRAAARAANGDDDRVVTIRANRATPPTGDADVIVPADSPPLRPAQPAAQPKKRRFGRTGR